MDFDALYAHYQTTHNFVPLLFAAPKAPGWGNALPPAYIHLLPTGADLKEALRAAFEDDKPLPPYLEWADWSTLPTANEKY